MAAIKGRVSPGPTSISEAAAWYANGGTYALENYVRILSARVTMARADILRLSARMTMHEADRLRRIIKPPIEEIDGEPAPRKAHGRNLERG